MTIEFKGQESQEPQAVTKAKKNTDYSASAVNLCNPVVIQEAHEVLRGIQQKKLDLQDRINACIPNELKVELANLEKEELSHINELKWQIDQFGSYQDLMAGFYALKQRKVSLSYDPNVLRIKHPKEAELVITEVVDSKKLDGLVKAGLLDKGSLITEGITKETESYAYIIK